jgi:hypothetical protein
MRLNQVDRICDRIPKIAARMLHGWILVLLISFIALRLMAYFGAYGCFGLLLLLVPAFAIYQSWKPWVRYVLTGK